MQKECTREGMHPVSECANWDDPDSVEDVMHAVPAPDVPVPARAGTASAVEALARVVALADVLHGSTVGAVRECGTFVREAIAGTLDADELDAFLGGRR